MDFTYFCQSLLNNDYEPCPSNFKWAVRKKDLVFVGLDFDRIKISIQGFQDWIFHFSTDESVVYGSEYPRVRAPKYPLLWFLNYLVDVLINTQDTVSGLNKLCIDKGVEVEPLDVKNIQRYMALYANHYKINSTRVCSGQDVVLSSSILSFGGIGDLKVHQSGAMLKFEYSKICEAPWCSFLTSSNNVDYRTLANLICYLNWGKNGPFEKWMSSPKRSYGIPEPQTEEQVQPPESDNAQETPSFEDNSLQKSYDAQAARAKAAEVRCAKILEYIQNNSEKGLFYLRLDSIGVFNKEIHQEIEKRLASLGFHIFRSDGYYVVTW